MGYGAGLRAARFSPVLTRSVTAALLFVALLSVACNDTRPTEPWNLDGTDTERTDADEEVFADGGDCDQWWSPPPGFEENNECGPGEFRFVDKVCSPSGSVDGGHNCRQRGDGRCYRKCETDADCPNPERPHCSTLGLFNYGDASCADSVDVCRSSCRDDCRY